MTGGMKSTLIREVETLSGLQSIENRRESKILVQEEKYKRLPSLPMYKRLKTQKSKPRLKRVSFNGHRARKSDSGQPLAGMENKTACRNLRNNQWYGVKIRDEPFRYQDKSQSTIEKYYPKQEWVRLYTDGSATDAIKMAVERSSTIDDKLNGTEYNLTQTVEFIKATGRQI